MGRRLAESSDRLCALAAVLALAVFVAFAVYRAASGEPILLGVTAVVCIVLAVSALAATRLRADGRG